MKKADKRTSESAVSLSYQFEMETVTKLAEENLTETQQWQKQWYDRITHEWGVQPDDEVLVLLPTMFKTS